MFELNVFSKRPISAAVQAAIYSMMLTTSVQAAPSGGQVVGGSGTISQSGVQTTINQASQNMAINWQSYNVNSNERVQYIQPNSASISLNRILSNNGSTIAGRIDANGQVILVNPNGIFFTSTAVVNVGGIIASGLDIKPDDFMNGNYIFDEVVGKDGKVINTGTINASLGGNVALVGKQVENDGLIAANLGTVTLAAGKQAVLTFDNGGVLGVRVSKAILQDELGVDPAVLNKGNIEAAGGRVLMTASTSQDVFSQAVNTGDIQQATSVVVNADGTFTLGAGADTVNTGSINTSTTDASQNPGQIVMLGNNVTSNGSLTADAANGNGGEIELHSTNTTLLTQDSVTSARSESNGVGGIVKVLGDKVGLFDQSTVDVSGANGGGQALVGGDEHGNNINIQNASKTIINSGVSIRADGLGNGDGGKVIVWSDGDTSFFGNLYTRGGELDGDGGFAEVSGKQNLQFNGFVNTTAANGKNGTLLLDPTNIRVRICGVAGRPACDTGGFVVTTGTPSTYTLPFSENTNNYDLLPSTLVTLLGNGNVVLQATRNISISDAVDSSSSPNSLTLQAGNNISITADVSLGGASNVSLGNFTMTSGDLGCSTSCDFSVGDIGVNSNITAGSVFIYSANDANVGGVLNLASLEVHAGNDVNISGDIITTGNISLSSADDTISAHSPSANPITGNINISGLVDTGGGDFSANAGISQNATEGYFDNSYLGGSVSAGTGNINITASGSGVSNSGVFSGTTSAGVFLGLISSANNLSVTTTSDQVIQSTDVNQNLSISGYASIDAGSNNIDLENTKNNLQGVIRLNTSSDAFLTNDSTITTLGATLPDTFDVGGNLTVNASQDLTIASDLTIGGTSIINFATDGNGHTFTVPAGITYTAGSSTITGGSNNDTFDLSSSISGTIDGSGGDDTFNIKAADLTFTDLRGGANGNDVLNAFDSQTDWTINNPNSGSLVSGLGTIAYSGMNTLNGALTSDDTFTFDIDPNLASVTIDGKGQAIRDSVVLGSTGPSGITLSIGNYTNIELYQGNGLGNTLQGINSGTNDWQITGANSGTVKNGAASAVSFQQFEAILGGTGSNDNFTLAGGSVAGYASTRGIDGNNGTNSITAPDSQANAWTIDTTTDGTVNGNTFTNIQSLMGGSGDDTFAFNVDPATVSVSIDGKGQTTQDVVALGAGLTNATLLVGSYTGIEAYQGNGDITNTLKGGNTQNTWEITGADSGTINGIPFTQFANLTGGTAGNDFYFGPNTGAPTPITTTGSLSGTLDGGSTSGNTLYARQGANTWNFTSATSGSVADSTNITYVKFQNIQSFNAGSATDVADVSTSSDTNFLVGSYIGFASIVGASKQNLIGDAGWDSSWIINGVNSGTVTLTQATASKSIDFSGFGTLTGSDATNSVSVKNQFTIASGGTFDTGLISGGNAVGGHTSINTLQGSPVGNSWTIDASDGGNLVYTVGTAITTNFKNIQNLVSGGSDTFTLGSNAANNTSGSLSGFISGTSTDILNDNLDNTTVQVMALPSSTVMAGRLNVYGVGTLNSATTNTNTMLVGANSKNTWLVNGTGSGVLNGVIAFNGFTDLTGNTGEDDFTLSGGGHVTGLIDGGGGIADTLTLDSTVSNPVIQLGSVINTGATQTVNNIATLINNSPAMGSLIGADSISTTTWNVAQQTYNATTYSSNSGTITGTGNGVTFLNFGDLQSGSGANTFKVDAPINSITAANGGNSITVSQTGSVAGAITSGTGNDTIQVSGSVGSITDNGGKNTIRIYAAGVDNGGISAGNGNDTVYVAGLVKGVIDGGTGTNTLYVTGAGDQTVQLGGSGAGGASLYTVDNFQSIIATNNASGNTLIGKLVNTTNNTWTINGANSGVVDDGALTTGFQQFANLTGGNGNDTFDYNTNGTLTGLIDGGSGSNTLNINNNAPTEVHVLVSLPTAPLTNAPGILSVYQLGTLNNNSTASDKLVGPDVNTTWAINTLNSGNLTPNGKTAISFTNFSYLTGGSADDTFKLTSTTTPVLIGGQIDGGGQATTTGDKLNLYLTGSAASATVHLGNPVVAGANNVTGIEMINGNAGGAANVDTTLVAADTLNNWDINSANGGVINSGTSSQVTFTNFAHVVGGANDDNFLVDYSGSLNFSIDGGDQITGDTADYSLQPVVNINFGAVSYNGITNLEGVRGNGTNSTLNGPDATTTWTIDGVNSGTVTSGKTSMTFKDFNYLVGGTKNDTYTVNGQGALQSATSGVAGLIHDKGGINTLFVNLADNGTSMGQIDYLGTGSDSIIINNNSTLPYLLDYTPVYKVTDTTNASNSGTYAQLNYHYADNTGINTSLDINYRSVGSVTSNQAVDTLSVNGAGNSGSVNLATGMFDVNGGLSVNYSNVTNLTANAGTGDTINVGDLTIGGTLTLENGPVSQQNGSLLTAGTLVLNNSGAIITQSAGLATSIANLDVENAADVYINQTGLLNLSGMNTAKLVDITSDANVVSTAALNSSGMLNINTPGDISLTGTNTLSGQLKLTGSQITLTNADTNLGDITAAGLNVTSTGNISDSGTITVAGATVLSSTGGDITLDDIANDFSTIQVDTNNNVTIYDASDIGLVSLNGASVSVTSGGQIYDANTNTSVSNPNITADSVTLSATGGIGGGSVNYDTTNGYSIDTSGAIYTKTANLSVINDNPNISTNKGTININNDGPVTIQDMRNNGDIILTASGDVLLEGLTQGAIDGDYTGTYTESTFPGSVAIFGSGTNSIFTNGTGPGIADITAENLIVQNINQFGTRAFPIRLFVRNQLTLIAGSGAFNYPFTPPADVLTKGDLVSIEGINGLSGQQLIDIESLGDVDPAIFTEVRNYNHEDVAILLPVDQRLDDEDNTECLDKKKCKKKQVIN